jgi:hypothetical protein
VNFLENSRNEEGNYTQKGKYFRNELRGKEIILLRLLQMKESAALYFDLLLLCTEIELRVPTIP